MIRITRHICPAIRFHRWSRKAYAAFASLGRVVLIARVGKSITEASLSKVGKYTRKEMRHRIPGYEGREEEPTPPDIGHPALELMLLAEPTIPAVPAASYPYVNSFHAARPALLPRIGSGAGRAVFYYKTQ